MAAILDNESFQKKEKTSICKKVENEIQNLDARITLSVIFSAKFICGGLKCYFLLF